MKLLSILIVQCFQFLELVFSVLLDSTTSELSENDALVPIRRHHREDLKATLNQAHLKLIWDLSADESLCCGQGCANLRLYQG